MTDYRNFVESKLANLVRRREDLDRQRQVIESEQNRLEAALSVLDEADAAREKDSRRPATNVPLPAATLNLIKNAGMMTADDLYDALSKQREIGRSHLHTALYRLKNRGKIFKSGNAWGMVGRDDGDSEAREHSDSLLKTTTTPNAS